MQLGHWLSLIALLSSLYILWQIHQIVFLVFMATILSTALNRLVCHLVRIGVKRHEAFIATVIVWLSGLTLIGLLLIPPLFSQLRQLIQLVPIGVQQLQVWVDRVQSWIPLTFLTQIESLENLQQQVQTQLQPFLNWSFQYLYALFTDSLAIFLNTLLAIVLTIMLLANPAAYRQGFILLFPAFYRQRIDAVLSQCEVSLVGWLAGITLKISLAGLITGLGLWLLSVPLPLINGVLAGVFAAVPILGILLSMMPPLILAALTSPLKAMGVLVLYGLVQHLEVTLVTPRVVKWRVSRFPALTLGLMTAFSVLFGVWGLFLALPIEVVAQIWVREVLIKDILDSWQTS